MFSAGGYKKKEMNVKKHLMQNFPSSSELWECVSLSNSSESKHISYGNEESEDDDIQQTIFYL